MKILTYLILFLIPIKLSAKGFEFMAGVGVSKSTKYIGSGGGSTAPGEETTEGGELLPAFMIGIYDNLSDQWNIGLLVSATPMYVNSVNRYFGSEYRYKENIGKPVCMAHFSLCRDINLYKASSLSVGLKAGISYAVIEKYRNANNSTLGTSFGAQIRYRYQLSKLLALYLDNSMQTSTFKFNNRDRGTNFIYMGIAGISLRI